MLPRTSQRPCVGTAGQLLARLTVPVDAASLAAFRVCFGLIMAWGGTRYLSGDWLRILFVGPQVHFRYPGFHWVPELSESGLKGVIGLLILSSLGVAAGLCQRVSAFLMLVSFTYLELLDVTNYLNHHYLAGLLCLILVFAPAHACCSIDRWMTERRGTRLPTLVPFFWIAILRFQLSCVYFYAGLAKLGTDWLIHGQPLQIWLTPKTELPLIGTFLELPAAPLLLSWCGFLYDTTIWAFLWAKRTRLCAYGVAFVFHSLTRAFFDIGLFPWIMTSATLIFFDPSWPRKLLDRSRIELSLPPFWPIPCEGPKRLREATGPSVGPASSESTALASRPGLSTPSPQTSWRLNRAAIPLAAVYAVVQLLVPLRHYLYPTDVLWEEDGMRFSWKVMIREKSASVDFLLRGERSGKERRISPLKYITPRQYREMGGQPDLIVQLAQHITEDVSDRWGEPVAIYADAKVSLNGRPAAPLLDPTCDLRQVDPSSEPLGCTLPHPGGPPPHLGSH